jgi:hypothetical protein
MQTWKIALIVAGAVAVLGTGTAVTIWALRRRKAARTVGCAPCALAAARKKAGR